MSLTTCTIHFSPRTDKTVYATKELLKSLQLTGAKSVTLKLGSRSATVPIKVLKRTGKRLYVPDPVKSHLLIPRNGTCLIVSGPGKEVRFGPLIGILTNASSSSVSQPFGARTSLLKSFIRAGSDKSYYFAFMAKDVNWQDETVTAYFPGNSGWVRKKVPLPDTVYNRLASRAVDKSVTMNQFKERLIRRGIPLFNWSFFDKWDVYHLLEDDPEVSRYVPESHVNPSSERIKDMLEKYRFVYLKPTGGSLGIGIYRLTYHPRRGYFARFRRQGKNVLIRFGHFNDLMKMISARSGKLRNYLVQQGIRLIELDSCPIDFRFHMHKNGQNEWVVAGIGAKKAGRGSVTTHVKNGGIVMTPEQALHKVFGSDAEATLQEAKKVAVKLAEAIERNGRYPLGELGLDIGIDQNGNIWMFEANSKPGRSIFKHPSLKEQGDASLAYIFEHSLYLSKFRTKGDA